MSILTRPRLVLAALRDRRHNQPAPTMARLSHIETEIVSAIRTAIHQRRERLASHIEPRRAQLAGDERDVATLRETFGRKIEQANGRTYPLAILSPATHWTLLVSITAGELAFNAQAFGLLGEATWKNWIMALAVGLTLPFIAGRLGFELRTGHWTRTKMFTWLGIGAATAIVLVFVNHLRTVFLATIYAGEAALVDGYAGLNIAYLAMNLFIFVAAAAISYAGNDPVRGFVRARRALVDVERRLMATRWRIARERALASADAQCLAEAGLNLVLLYRSANRRGRAAVPRYFDMIAEPDYAPRVDPTGDTPFSVRDAEGIGQDLVMAAESAATR